MRWACSSGTKRPSAGSRRSCVTIGRWQRVRTMSGRWNWLLRARLRLVLDQLATGKTIRVLTVVDIFS